MFCFCLQSSLLKLQALEVDSGPSLGASPEESPPVRGNKEQKSPGGPAAEGKTLALCHSENSPPELLTVSHHKPPQSPRIHHHHHPLTTIHPGGGGQHQPPLTPEGGLPTGPHHSPFSPFTPYTPHPSHTHPNPSYQPYSPQHSPGCEVPSVGGGGGGVGWDLGGGGGGGGGGGDLLQFLGGGPSPLPSPRCSSLSHRFSSDPETAPSPPCSQQYILHRSGSPRQLVPEDPCPSSVPSLSRHIQTLKKRVRRFEDQFEQEMNYKPSYNDKYSNPEMIRVMNELAKARKQLKELRLRQSVFESKEQDGPENVCRSTSGQQGATEHSPTLEDTVESLLGRLREKRQSLGLPEDTKEMTQAQMVLEKITLQKCLLYFESLHGRPGTRQEKGLVKPLYDRYQMIKRLLCASPTITTIEEEEDCSDEDCLTVSERLTPPTRLSACLSAREEESDRDSDPAFVSPIDEVKTVHQQQTTPAVLTTANLHEASRSQLLACLRATSKEKKSRRKALREFEDEFQRQTGRICQKEDRSPMKEEYQEYKQLKAKLRLLEVLLSKQEVTRTK